MRNEINLNNNNLQSGYIYKKLVERIDELEKQIKTILTSIEQAKNDMTISVKDYLTIIKILDDCVRRDEFIRHIENKEIHYHESQQGGGGSTEPSDPTQPIYLQLVVDNENKTGFYDIVTDDEYGNTYDVVTRDNSVKSTDLPDEEESSDDDVI